MSFETKHPQYLDVIDDYRTVRDTFKGERHIKEQAFLYLRATMGQLKDGAARNVRSTGWAAYESYRHRATFPEFVQEAAEALVGVMHSEPAVIKLPAALEPMRDNASRKGETLQMLLRKINEQQLLYGRYGLLADFPQDPFFASQATTPHLVGYNAETIINWDDERMTEHAQNSLSFVVFNETIFTRGTQDIQDFEWNEERQFRVLQLMPEDPEQPLSVTNPLVYTTVVENDGILQEAITPAFRGGTLEEIPFVFIGANDLNPEPDTIPLLKLANVALATYRGDADYRQALHMTGQDTLVIIGEEITKDGDNVDEDAATEVGAGAIIRLSPGEGSGAEFIGVESKGLGELSKSQEKLHARGNSMGARLLEPRGSQAESGDALRIRVSASTAGLKTVALTGAEGLAAILRICARWVGADPNEVEVIPNLDFTQETPSPELLRALSQSLEGGIIPLSMEAIHKWMQDRNFTKFTFQEELDKILAEQKIEALNRRTATPEVPANDPADPENDDETPDDEGSDNGE